MNSQTVFAWMLGLALACSSGCEKSPLPADGNIVSQPVDVGAYPVILPEDIQFFDDAKSNAEEESDDVAGLSFVSPEGESVSVKNFAGQKNLVLVVTRGNTTPICPYCSTQTSRLIANYEQFAQRDAEVLVVYPVEAGEHSERLEVFLTRVREILADPQAQVPFPLALDVQLKAVDKLGIREQLSKPATYILDPQGQVRFAYVGKHVADRPSIKAIFSRLDELNSERGPSE